MSIAQITAEIAAQLRLPSTDGVIVLSVVDNGPADRASVKPGNIITAVDGESTRSPEDFLAILRGQEPGDTLQMRVRTPEQDEREVRVTLADRP